MTTEVHPGAFKNSGVQQESFLDIPDILGQKSYSIFERIVFLSPKANPAPPSRKQPASVPGVKQSKKANAAKAQPEPHWQFFCDLQEQEFSQSGPDALTILRNPLEHQLTLEEAVLFAEDLDVSSPAERAVCRILLSFLSTYLAKPGREVELALGAAIRKLVALLPPNQWNQLAEILERKEARPFLLLETSKSINLWMEFNPNKVFSPPHLLLNLLRNRFSMLSADSGDAKESAAFYEIAVLLALLGKTRERDYLEAIGKSPAFIKEMVLHRLNKIEKDLASADHEAALLRSAREALEALS